MTDRACGAQALGRRLDSLTGGRQTVLMERGGVGYTPCFTKVGLDTDTAPGTLLPVIITGRNGDHLTGIAA